MRQRKARILYDKKNDAYYVFNKGEKVYLNKKPTAGNINIINKIINKLPDYRADIKNPQIVKRGRRPQNKKQKRKVLNIPTREAREQRPTRESVVSVPRKKDAGIWRNLREEELREQNQTTEFPRSQRSVPTQKQTRDKAEEFKMIAPLNLYGKFKSYNDLEKLGIKDTSTLSLISRLANPMIMPPPAGGTPAVAVGGTPPAPIPIQFQINPVMNPMAPFNIPIQPQITPVMNPMAPFQIPIQPQITPVVNQPQIAPAPPVEIKLVDDDDKTISSSVPPTKTKTTTIQPPSLGFQSPRSKTNRPPTKLSPKVTGIGVPPPEGKRIRFPIELQPPAVPKIDEEDDQIIEPLEEEEKIPDIPLEQIEIEDGSSTRNTPISTVSKQNEEKKKEEKKDDEPDVNENLLDFNDVEEDIKDIGNGLNDYFEANAIPNAEAKAIVEKLKLEKIEDGTKPIVIKYLDRNRVIRYENFKSKGDLEQAIKSSLTVYDNISRPSNSDIKNLVSLGLLNKAGKNIKNKRSIAIIKTLIPDATNDGIQILDGKQIFKKAKGSGYYKKIEKLLSRKGGYNTPLWDGELVDMLAPYKAFLGVVMRDEVGNILKEADERKIDRFGFVQNLDSSDMEGSHWVGWFIDLTGDKMICYYDPFGKKAQSDVLEKIREWAKKKVPYYLKFKSNRVSQQASKSNRCGYHVAKWLIHMFKTNDFKGATDYEGIVESENEAKKMEKTWKKFGYV